MAGNHWKDYLVKIIIPGSQGRDFIATGYPFRRGYILTARHAIDQPDCDASRQWRLVWEHQKDVEQKAIERKIDKPVIITSSNALDWAVIQYDFDEALHHAICFCVEPLVGGSYVESEGFPAIRHANPDGLSHLGSQGTSHSKATDENYFQIDVNAGYPNPHKAGGLSGAPVLNSAGHIIGLFAQVPAHLDGKTVWVLSMASILRDERFSDLLTPEQKSPRYSAIKKLLESKDYSGGLFRDFLINVFQPDGDSIATEKIV